MVAKRTALAERVQTINQARALVLTGPDDIRARFAKHATGALMAELAALRPRPGSMVRYHTLLSLRELGKRTQFPGQQIDRLDELIVPLVTARAPGLLARYGVGPHTAAMLLIAAGDHPERLRPTPPGRTCAPPHRSPPPPAKSNATGTAPMATGRPTMPCGRSSSPG
jgi:hypothetical protein